MGWAYEVLYRVDLWRRFLPADSGGVRRAGDLIQFYGLRATRRRPSRAGTEFSPWESEGQVKLHTVDVSRDLTFRKRK